MQTCMTKAATEPGNGDADGLPGQNNVGFLFPTQHGSAGRINCAALEGEKKRGSFQANFITTL